MRHPILALLFALLLAAPAAAIANQARGEAAWESKHALDLGLRDPLHPDAAVLHHDIAPPMAERIAALREANAQPGAKLLQIGIESAVAAPAPALHWRTLPDGGHSAWLAARSDGAQALRLALDVVELPAGAVLRFAGASGDVAVAAVDAAAIARQRAIHPQYWSPVTDGDVQRVEIALPPGADPAHARLSLQAVSHLFVLPSGSLAGAKVGESDDCEFDAKCVNNPSAAYTAAKAAVARMVFQSGGSSSLCTGTLLNDTDAATQVPYFFTAAHCFTSQSVANSLTTFWFYEASSCGAGDLDTAAQRQVTGGATVLYADTASDVLFLRLNNPPPTGAVFLGWNASAVTSGNSILVLHHPAGDTKKVSLGQIRGFGSSSLASGSFIKVGYTDGTTEGGSSGCGLLTFSNNEYQLRGGLLGGSASCDNTGSLSNSANSDDFSRLDQAFPNLQQYLQPAATAAPDYSGAWSNAAQNGWGLNVIRGSSGAYGMYIYHYDEASTPAWYLAAGPLSGSTFTGTVFTFNGPWFGISPFNPALVGNRSSGTLTVTFSSPTEASINFTIDGRSVSTTLTKLVF